MRQEDMQSANSKLYKEPEGPEDEVPLHASFPEENQNGDLLSTSPPKYTTLHCFSSHLCTLSNTWMESGPFIMIPLAVRVGDSLDLTIRRKIPPQVPVAKSLKSVESPELLKLPVEQLWLVLLVVV